MQALYLGEACRWLRPREARDLAQVDELEALIITVFFKDMAELEEDRFLACGFNGTKLHV
jgi:hypothetical protein